MAEEAREPMDGGVPAVPAGKEGRTGYGPLEGPMTGPYGEEIDRMQDYPADCHPLVKGAWFNWSLTDEFPAFVARDVEENRRMWQDIELERMLDHTPPHEVHANDLPDYHFWPRIQNELHPTPKRVDLANVEHYQDQSHLPRFHKTGVPKTPPQEQDWYVPMGAAGRFDWRRNIKQNGYSGSLFDKVGWEKRYLLALDRPMVPGPLFLLGGRVYANKPINFRHFELPLTKRITRTMSASYFERHAIMSGFYLAFLIYMSGNDAHHKKLAWGNEPWNFELEFARYARDKGGFHSLV
jgi:hypothetical protein